MAMTWVKTIDKPIPVGELLLLYWENSGNFVCTHGHRKCTADYWARINHPKPSKPDIPDIEE